MLEVCRKIIKPNGWFSTPPCDCFHRSGARSPGGTDFEVPVEWWKQTDRSPVFSVNTFKHFPTQTQYTHVSFRPNIPHMISNYFNNLQISSFFYQQQQDFNAWTYVQRFFLWHGDTGPGSHTLWSMGRVLRPRDLEMGWSQTSKLRVFWDV